MRESRKILKKAVRRSFGRQSPASNDQAILFSYSAHFKRGGTQAEEPIFQFAIRLGLYARPGTLYTHKTVARFAQGLADLYHQAA